GSGPGAGAGAGPRAGRLPACGPSLWPTAPRGHVATAAPERPREDSYAPPSWLPTYRLVQQPKLIAEGAATTGARPRPELSPSSTSGQRASPLSGGPALTKSQGRDSAVRGVWPGSP